MYKTRIFGILFVCCMPSYSCDHIPYKRGAFIQVLNRWTPLWSSSFVSVIHLVRAEFWSRVNWVPQPNWAGSACLQPYKRWQGNPVCHSFKNLPYLTMWIVKDPTRKIWQRVSIWASSYVRPMCSIFFNLMYLSIAELGECPWCLIGSRHKPSKSRSISFPLENSCMYLSKSNQKSSLYWSL